MWRNETRSLALGLIIAVVLAGCAGPPATVAIPTGHALPTPASVMPVWSIAPPASQPAPLQIRTTTNLPYTGKQLLDVYAPASSGDWPVVILLHGGPQTKGGVRKLAAAIAERGAVVFAPTYRSAAPTNAAETRGGPEDAACAVRTARATAFKYGGHANRVIIVGVSAGGYIGGLLSVAGDEFHGDCLVQDGSAVPDAFVGLDGVYEPFATSPDDIFPASVLEQAPAQVLKIDPIDYVSRTPRRDNVRFLLFVGSWITGQRHGQAFRDALRGAGYWVDIYQIPGLPHNEFGLPQPATIDGIANLLHP